MATKVNSIGKKSKAFYFSVFFLSFILVITVILKIVNINIKDDIKNIQTKVEQTKLDIGNLMKNKRISIVKLLDAHKNYLYERQKLSNINKLVNLVSGISETYGINFKGFNYKRGKINLDATSISNEDGVSFQKIQKFVNAYRNNKELKLNFINSFTGNDSINFQVSLEVNK